MSDKLDLSPAVLDLTLYAGDGTTFQINLVDDDDVVMDVSGINWAAQIRKKRTLDPAYDLEIITDEAVNGIIYVHIPAEITKVLPKSAQWDLQSTPEGKDDPLTILQGAVTCNPDVTRIAETVP